MSLEKLFEMQQLDIKIKSIENKAADLIKDTEMRRLKEEYLKLKAIFEKDESLQKSNTAQLETKNNEIKNLNSDKKSMEDMKYSKTTDSVKKLENVDKHIEKIEERLELAENNIIKLSEEGKNIEKDLNDIKKKMSFIKRKYLLAKDKYQVSLNELNEQKDALDVLKKLIGSEIEGMEDKELLETYHKLKRRYDDPVSDVVDKRCTGCNVEIPSMEYEALRAHSRILRCESCGRLLLLRSI